MPIQDNVCVNTYKNGGRRTFKTINSNTFPFVTGGGFELDPSGLRK